MPDTTFPNRQLARRSFIKSLAGLGLLSTLQAEQLFAQTRAPVRVLFVPLQHGWGGGGGSLGSISGSEFEFQLPDYWRPFDAIKQHCVFVDGLRGTFWGNAHDASYSDILTAAVPVNAANEPSLGGPFPMPVAPSIDFLLEEYYRMPALRLSARYSSWGAAYHPLSFNRRQENLGYYRTAYEAYNSVFTSTSAPEQIDTSVDPVVAELFPYLSQDTQRIIQTIRTGDETQRNKLLGYLDAVTAVQQKAEARASGGAATAMLRNVPARVQSLGQEIDHCLDMVRVAFSNDTHRVAVVGMGEQNNAFTWTNEAGVNHVGHSSYTGDFHHDVAHYNEGKPRDAELAYIGWTQYYAQKIANFALDLHNTVDTDGKPLLDNTVIVLTGEVGNGTHDRRHKPHIVIGGGGGAIRTGRWYQTPRADARDIGSRDAGGTYRSIASTTSWLGGQHSHFSHADLFTRIANLAGLNIPSVGIDSMNVGPLDI